MANMQQIGRDYSPLISPQYANTMSASYSKAAAQAAQRLRGHNDCRSMRKKDVVEPTIPVEDEDEESQILMEGSVEGNHHANHNQEN